ncbi:MAG TPA: alpha-galactosidase [Cyclobacteriaceae bacterium]|nr:alpha-galactosidase [Cyclobacteriaceae bacterium]
MVSVRNVFVLFVLVAIALVSVQAQTIGIHTDATSLVFKVDKSGELRQCYFGGKVESSTYDAIATSGFAAHPAYGKDYVYEPALRVVHADGNLTTELIYANHDQRQLQEGITLTQIVLKDKFYPLTVTLNYKTYNHENIIEQWTEIAHQEKKDITLHNFFSSHLTFQQPEYWLTSFSGNWAKEMNMAEVQLKDGSKILESKLGVRANQFGHAAFLLALDGPAQEAQGTVIGGTLAWPGSWKLSFETDAQNNLKVLAGINPFASQYTLKAKEVFKTPALLYTLSTQGKGEVTRRFHKWARNHNGMHKSERPRYTLLNNWEATYFDFNEAVLKQIIADAADMGFDLSLLDDGWFANKYPRDHDRAGLGDWEVNKMKLPNGVGELVTESQKKNIKFGIWIEPEMVNPKSELYEKHPDWIITAPNRELDLSRNQLILDLSNPKVQDHVYGVVDNLLTQNPDIAYLKWDCNRYITNAGSSYLPANQQTHLWIKYVEGLFNVLKKVRSKYPNVYIMLCSGGGGRIDYGTMPFFDEYWISDNTDALDRIFIQWGTTHFFPPIGLASHVSVVPNHITQRITPLKFRFDVAMAAKLGMDLQPKDMTADEKAFSRNAIKEYSTFKHIIQDGDLYRLLSPYENNRVALMYTLSNQREALVFSYLKQKEIYGNNQILYMHGLDPKRNYTIKEVNNYGMNYSRIAHLEGKSFTGEFLMTHGVRFTMYNEYESVVFKLVTE